MPERPLPRPEPSPGRPQACLGHAGGHTTWTCRACDQTVYGPPMDTHCTALEGPAAVRISSGSLPTDQDEHEDSRDNGHRDDLLATLVLLASWLRQCRSRTQWWVC